MPWKVMDDGTLENCTFSCHHPSVLGYRYVGMLWGCLVIMVGVLGNVLTTLAFVLNGCPYTTVLLFLYFFVGLGCVGFFHFLIHQRGRLRPGHSSGYRLRHQVQLPVATEGEGDVTHYGASTAQTRNSEISSEPHGLANGVTKGHSPSVVTPDSCPTGTSEASIFGPAQEAFGQGGAIGVLLEAVGKLIRVLVRDELSEWQRREQRSCIAEPQRKPASTNWRAGSLLKCLS
ncbi:hypothetical protein AAFF_G00298640 [Aldrovandia affinis]|uniref:Uncharacterized protein n=1 Tax=Aldrovandia affinis TaxID=143900 RepID=A0AAD7W113_9TELE|nr:hypothetical protein AAFF_G00298640 [Aldrovandia affinis]